MSDVVPEFIDPPAPPLLRTARPFRWFTWLAVLPVLPFAPKRIGVRLSASSWSAAVSSYLVCAVVALLIVGYVDSLLFRPQPLFGITIGSGMVAPSPPTIAPDLQSGLLERAQNAVTSAINMLYTRTSLLGDIYGLFGIMLALAILSLALGVLAMPYIAAGERLKRLLGRAVKLSLFSATMLVVAATALGVIVRINLTSPEFFERIPSGPFAAAATAGIAAWWFSVIIRMGRLYAGPPEGPAWQPVRPRCLACGYVLTGLPRDGDCPECGLTIADSLNENRTTSAWAAARKLSDQPSGWLRTSLAVFRDPNFFRRLDVTGGTSKAIDFAGLSSAFPAAVFAAGGILAGIFVTDSPHAAIWLRITLATFLGLAAFCAVRLVFFGVLSLIGLLVGYRRGVDPRAVTVAICYSSARLLPAWAALTAIVLLQDVFAGVAAGVPWLPVGIGTLLLLIPCLMLLRAALQIRKSVREVVGAAG